MASSWGLSWGSSWGNSWGTVTPPRPSGGGFVLSEKYFKDLRAAAERASAAEAKSRSERVRERAELRKALETAWKGAKDTAPEVFAEAAPEVDFERKRVNWTPLLRSHDAVLRFIGGIEALLASQRERQRRLEAERLAREAERRRQAVEDESVAVLLLFA